MAMLTHARVSCGTTPSFQRYGQSSTKHTVDLNIAKLAQGGVREGSKLKETRMRMKAVKNIAKITKTMKMIASARLKAAQRRMNQVQAFSGSSSRAFDELKVEAKAKKEVILPVCSDRGLCGALNSNIAKMTRKMVEERKGRGIEVGIVCIGDKAQAQLKRLNAHDILFAVGEVSKKPATFAGVCYVIDKLLKNTEYDQVTIVYNKYASALAFVPTPRTIPSYTAVLANPEKLYGFEFEDDNSAEHLRDLYEFTLGSMLYAAMAENNASELGSRMTAMDNATRNATALLGRLSVSYNRARQAAITTELSEIISGASSVSATPD